MALFLWSLFEGRTLSWPVTAEPHHAHGSHSVHSRSRRHQVDDWLRDNSNDVHAFEYVRDGKPLRQQLFSGQNLLRALGLSSMRSSRPNAAIISLVRNEELDGIVQSMSQLEMRWNWKYRYPWVFLSESEFSEEFKVSQRHRESQGCSTCGTNDTGDHIKPDCDSSLPMLSYLERTGPHQFHVSRQRFAESLSYLNTLGVGKGHLLSYRHMCRWNSKFFYQHPALTQYDYYWRVEPDVHFFCDIKYDPFRLLRDNDLVYGFNMLILDDARSFPSLWRVTKEFLTSHADLVPGENMDDLPAWLVDGRTSEYNNCQFFSNFEIGSLSFFRAKGPQAYVNFLDSVPSPFLSPLDNPHNHTNNKSNTAQSIFYTSRTGDAPVHTLSLALFAGRSRIHFFRDIGYQHDIARHCLPTSVNGKERCDCEPTGLDENFYRLVPMESPQWKPEDTCIRLFLGDGQDDEVSWLKKKEGWDKEVEMKFGGDGYGGYVRQG